MLGKTSYQQQPHTVDYNSRTPQYYLDRLDYHIFESFTQEQIEAITAMLTDAIPKQSPKIVDLRFTIDLIISRFYFVFLVGKDRRKKQRRYVTEGVSKIGNLIAVVILLIGLNLLISSFIILFVYLSKTFLGIDIIDGLHFSDVVKMIL